jgi:hypothetical protein
MDENSMSGLGCHRLGDVVLLLPGRADHARRGRASYHALHAGGKESDRS